MTLFRALRIISRDLMRKPQPVSLEDGMWIQAHVHDMLSKCDPALKKKLIEEAVTEAEKEKIEYRYTVKGFFNQFLQACYKDVLNERSPRETG